MLDLLMIQSGMATARFCSCISLPVVSQPLQNQPLSFDCYRATSHFCAAGATAPTPDASGFLSQGLLWQHDLASLFKRTPILWVGTPFATPAAIGATACGYDPRPREQPLVVVVTDA